VVDMYMVDEIGKYLNKITTAKKLVKVQNICI
jgi:hypothetical protein